MNTKATLYLDAKVFRALKVKAALTDKTVSETANELISQGLEGSGPVQGAPGSKVEIKYEGKMKYPVLSGLKFPKDYVFKREDLYD